MNRGCVLGIASKKLHVGIQGIKKPNAAVRLKKRWKSINHESLTRLAGHHISFLTLCQELPFNNVFRHFFEFIRSQIIHNIVVIGDSAVFKDPKPASVFYLIN